MKNAMWLLVAVVVLVFGGVIYMVTQGKAETSDKKKKSTGEKLGDAAGTIYDFVDGLLSGKK